MELALSLGDSDTPKPFPFLQKPQKTNLGFFCMSVDDHQDPPLQLDLLPPSNNLTLPWLTNKSDANRRGDDAQNSMVSSFQMDLRDFDQINGEGETASRGSDEDENGNSSRKKLRLTREQSAFLEESFKEQNTLNPKQKLALAKQLNLRPRQVEVWFQNRRARTKLKQTEVDCEYLKRWCETLTEENRRLQKELHELRALKASQPFYKQLPATTLTMCPSCEKVAVAATSGVSGAVDKSGC